MIQRAPVFVFALWTLLTPCGCSEGNHSNAESSNAGPTAQAPSGKRHTTRVPSSDFTSPTSIDQEPAETQPKKSDDWPRFRGPNGTGTSNEKGLPAKWSATEKLLWKRELPGPGASSPIVVGKRIYVTCYSGYGLSKSRPGDPKDLKRHLVCLDRKTGKILWNKQPKLERLDHGYTGFMCLHGYASNTPVADGERIYAYFGNCGAYAFDKDGKQLWHVDCGHGAHSFGSGGSPVLHGKLLIVNASIESHCLIALNKTTGKEVWRVKNVRDAWNTPVIVKAAGRSEVVISTRDAILGIDADSGKSLWKWIGTKGKTYVCPSLVPHKGVLYGLPSYHGPVAAIRAGGSGDVSRSHTVWTSPHFRTTVTSPVYHDGHLYYAHDDGGYLVCIDAASGKEKKRIRAKPTFGRLYASPLVADGKLYIVTRTRGAFVFKATPALEQLAVNKIAGDDSIFNASPVPHAGQLLLRSDKYLYCIGDMK